jgi:hypothetical protein
MFEIAVGATTHLPQADDRTTIFFYDPITVCHTVPFPYRRGIRRLNGGGSLVFKIYISDTFFKKIMKNIYFRRSASRSPVQILTGLH